MKSGLCLQNSETSVGVGWRSFDGNSEVSVDSQAFGEDNFLLRLAAIRTEGSHLPLARLRITEFVDAVRVSADRSVNYEILCLSLLSLSYKQLAIR